MRDLWKALPRFGRLGAVIALAAALPLVPFLWYAGIAVANGTAQFAQPFVGEGASIGVAILAFGVYVGLLVGVLGVVGVSAGLVLGFIRKRFSGGGA
jgi:uncharacterized membrane protein